MQQPKNVEEEMRETAGKPKKAAVSGKLAGLPSDGQR